MRRTLTTDYAVGMRRDNPQGKLKYRQLGVSALSNMNMAHLNRAQRIAEQGTMKQRHGAVIVAGGRVVSVGINSFRNDPRTVGHAPEALSVCAELAAIKAIGIGADFRGMTIYVARISPGGKPLNSKPCRECWMRLTRLGFKEAIYT